MSCVDAAIDQILEQAMDNVEYMEGETMVLDKNCSVSINEAHAMADQISSDALHGIIAAAIGSVNANNAPCPLFTTSVDELEYLFHS